MIPSVEDGARQWIVTTTGSYGAGVHGPFKPVLFSIWHRGQSGVRYAESKEGGLRDSNGHRALGEPIRNNPMRRHGSGHLNTMRECQNKGKGQGSRTGIDCNGAREGFDTTSVPRLPIQMYLKHCEVYIVDVREVQFGRLKWLVNVRVVCDI